MSIQSSGKVLPDLGTRIRVLIAKPGLDGHETGAKLIARVLRDAGMEVIYTGMRATPESIATAALQEDVRVIGMSILSGAHKELCARITEKLREVGVQNVVLLVGGIIPAQDIPILKAMGIHGVFGPGSNTQDMIDFIRHEVSNRQAAHAPASTPVAAHSRL